MMASSSDVILDSDMVQYAPLIILLPMLAFPVILFLGRVFNKNPFWKNTLKEGGLIALPVMAASFIISLLLIKDHIGSFAEIKDSLDILWVNTTVWDGGVLEPVTLGFGIYVDHVTVMLLFVASFLCLLINIFSVGYMNTDPINDNRNHRFYAEFVLFCAGMLGMVLADSFLWLFIFWEIMGLCSYLLIGFYYERPSAAYAAKKAFLTTRIGDVFLMIGLVMIWDLFGSLDYAVVFDETKIAEVAAQSSGTLQWALGMMFIGAVGKSAQFPLHVWLPDAMEGPTPVSALIHAATMVNAGLYLVARMFPFFGAEALHGDLVDLAFIIALVGGITAVMAAAIAFVQNDLKKVLAYSTMSQLAYIFTGLGCAMYLANTLDWHNDSQAHYIVVVAFGAALFHLFNHAMAKGMLFMASGSVIHEVHHAHHHLHHHDDHHDDDFDAQSMENMGGLASKMPLTATAMLVGSASIMGLPFIGGFWSKEGIIANAWRVAQDDPRFLLPAMCVLIGAGMTGFYMSRMWLKTFAGKPNNEVAAHVGPTNTWIKIPLFTLTFVTLSAIILAGMGFTHWASDSEYSFMSEKGLLGGIGYEMEHAFANSDSFYFILTYVAIAIGAVLGPGIAMSLYGGNLAEGEQTKPWMKPVIRLNAWVYRRFNFNNSSIAESSLTRALEQRLYIDYYYDMAMLKIVAAFSKKSAEADSAVIDGTIKNIERGSQSLSSVVRSLTTGSARDYILMISVGTLAIFFFLWGVA
ncbi:MAG: proton-conducting transporter membrane subunit [Candidatus Poseidoniaceae archaeon]|jgi:NADH-quinone oxidoreductase subunit L|nr:proton-conducting transporter membrane subunit [Candidatus Poseidoniaceae archaeon]